MPFKTANKTNDNRYKLNPYIPYSISCLPVDINHRLGPEMVSAELLGRNAKKLAPRYMNIRHIYDSSFSKSHPKPVANIRKASTRTTDTSKLNGHKAQKVTASGGKPQTQQKVTETYTQVERSNKKTNQEEPAEESEDILLIKDYANEDKETTNTKKVQDNWEEMDQDERESGQNESESQQSQSQTASQQEPDTDLPDPNEIEFSTEDLDAVETDFSDPLENATICYLHLKNIPEEKTLQDIIAALAHLSSITESRSTINTSRADIAFTDEDDLDKAIAFCKKYKTLGIPEEKNTANMHSSGIVVYRVTCSSVKTEDWTKELICKGIKEKLTRLRNKEPAMTPIVYSVVPSKESPTINVDLDYQTWRSFMSISDITVSIKAGSEKQMIFLKCLRHLSWTSDPRFVKLWIGNFPIEYMDGSAIKKLYEMELQKKLDCQDIRMLAIARSEKNNYSRGFGFIWVTNSKTVRRLLKDPPTIKGIKKYKDGSRRELDFKVTIKVPTKPTTSLKGRYTETTTNDDDS
jgi:hypothetical protein